METIKPISDILGNLSDNYGRYYGHYEFQTSAIDGSGIFSQRRLSRKAWVFSGTISEEYITGFAIVDAGMAATAFCYIKNRTTGEYLEENMTKPFGFPENFSPSLSSTWSLQDGKKSWKYTKTGDEYRFEYLGDQFSLQFTMQETGNGISTIAPSQDRPFNFTYKNMNLPTKVVFSQNGKESRWEGSIGVLDFSKGYPPREIFWNWASLVGTTDKGDSFGLNAVAHYNDGLENIYWLNGKPFPLGKAVFTYDKPISENQTRLIVEGDLLNLQFYPEGKRSEDLNYIFFKSQFTQAFGKFKGILNHEGEKVTITGNGLLEEHSALW
jgi:hypothetical protein